MLTVPPGHAAPEVGHVEVPFHVQRHRLVRPALRTWPECLGDVFDEHSLPVRIRHHGLVALGCRLHRGPEPGERIGEDLLTLGDEELKHGVPPTPGGVPRFTVQLDQPADVVLLQRKAPDDDRHGTDSFRVIRGQGEHVRAAAAASDRVDGIEAEMVEKLRGIVCHDRDPAPRQSARRAVAGPVEHDHSNVEAVV